MFRAVTVLCTIAVFLVIFEQVSCHWHRHDHHRSGHHHHHRGPPHHRGLFLNVLIYAPKGLELSTPQYNSTAQYFGFDMFINNPNGGTPDVSHNTTEVTYRKYIVRDTEVIIKPGDTLKITHYMGFSNGGVMQSTFILPVYQHMISNNCTCANETGKEIRRIPPWSRTTTISPPTTNDPRSIGTWKLKPSTMRTTVPTTTTPSWNMEQSHEEYDEEYDCEIDPTTNLCIERFQIDMRNSGMSRQQPEKLVNSPDRDVNMDVFMDIFNTEVNQCRTKPRTNYLKLANPMVPTDASTDWVGYVRRMLKQRLNLTRLANKGLVDARPSRTAIVFEMDTLFNKMQVLYYARKSGMMSLMDYDEI